MNQTQNKQILIFSLLVFLSVALGYFLPKFKTPSPLSSLIPNPFASILLEAKTAFVYDLANQKMLFGLHEDKPMPIASITKIMTALVALEVFSPEEVIMISRDSLDLEGDNGLFWGEKWPVSELIKFMLLVSSNDAAAAIAKEADKKLGLDGFLQKMNEKAEEIGLAKARFNSVSGIDMGETPGAVASAKEAAFLLYYAYKTYPEIFGITALPEADFISESGFDHKKIKNTNPNVGTGNILASKTGLTKLAGGTLVVFLGGERPLLIAALGSTQEGRFADVTRLEAAALLTKTPVAE